MKYLLFIIPSRANAGTNSSLSCIYNELKEHYNIEVLSIISKGIGIYDYNKVTFSLPLIEAYYGDYSDLKGKTKIYSIFIKLIKRISIHLKLDFKTLLLKRVINSFEKKKKFDYVIGFQEGEAMYVSSLFHIPNKITWIHCDYVRAYPDKDELSIYDKFKNIVCVSNFTLNRFINKYPSLTDKSISIHNLVDYYRIDRLKNETINDPSFINDVFTIVSMGRMDPIKRFGDIPKIAKEIKDRGLQFKWYILGGPCNEVYKDVADKIIKFGLQNNIYLLGNKSNPYPYLLNSDVLVSTSSSEACPMIFTEALSCGIPIVSADFGSATEFVSEGINGYVRSINKLSEIISKLICDKREYEIIKQSCVTSLKNNDEIINNIKKLFAE